MNRQVEQGYRLLTAADSFRLMLQGKDPWLALGQFLDDWGRTEPSGRADLIQEPLEPAPAELVRWVALLAAAVESLCDRDGLPFPSWTGRPEYHLPEPWFLYPGWRLRAWQLFETPAPFRLRNIFGGDRILARV